MKKLIILILLIPTLASAEHHRSHTLFWVDGLDVELNQMEKSLSYFEQGCAFDAIDQNSIDIIYRYSDRIKAGTNLVRDILADPDGDLDAARRLINRPSHEGAHSMTYNIRIVTYFSKQLIGACPSVDNKLRSVFQRIALSWEKIDRAIWHTNDAIREEIYADPDFICAGPDNHCE